jgi:hypothetical protein
MWLFGLRWYGMGERYSLLGCLWWKVDAVVVVVAQEKM